VRPMWKWFMAVAYFAVLMGVGVWGWWGRHHQEPAEVDPFLQEWRETGDLEEGEEPERAANRMGAAGLPSPRLYPPVPMEKIAEKDGWPRPRCLIEGTVVMRKVEDDGDSHFVVEADGHRVVCEIVPEFKVDAPKVGQTVQVWGIPRWDGQHKWGEIHPVIGWKAK
jgi:hypothetical protein